MKPRKEFVPPAIIPARVEPVVLRDEPRDFISGTDNVTINLLNLMQRMAFWINHSVKILKNSALRNFLMRFREISDMDGNSMVLTQLENFNREDFELLPCALYDILEEMDHPDLMAEEHTLREELRADKIAINESNLNAFPGDIYKLIDGHPERYRRLLKGIFVQFMEKLDLIRDNKINRKRSVPQAIRTVIADAEKYLRQFTTWMPERQSIYVGRIGAGPHEDDGENSTSDTEELPVITRTHKPAARMTTSFVVRHGEQRGPIHFSSSSSSSDGDRRTGRSPSTSGDSDLKSDSNPDSDSNSHSDSDHEDNNDYGGMGRYNYNTLPNGRSINWVPPVHVNLTEEEAQLQVTVSDPPITTTTLQNILRDQPTPGSRRVAVAGAPGTSAALENRQRLSAQQQNPTRRAATPQTPTQTTTQRRAPTRTPPARQQHSTQNTTIRIEARGDTRRVLKPLTEEQQQKLQQEANRARREARNAARLNEQLAKEKKELEEALVVQQAQVQIKRGRLDEAEQTIRQE
ncbi:MAG: hypothetical protein ACK5VJ_01170 [Pseudomonadota bacterium]